MKKILISISFLLLSILSIAQPGLENVVSGTFNTATSSPGGSSDFQATGFFNDLTSRWSDSDIAAGMIFWDSDGNRFEVIAKSGSGAITLDLRDIDGVGTVATGLGAVMVETANYPVEVPGISSELQSLIDNHFKQIIALVSPAGSNNSALQVSGPNLEVVDGGGAVSASLADINFSWKEEYISGITGTSISITVGTPTGDPAEFILFRNGIQQRPGGGFDYTIAGTTITINKAATTSEDFRVLFREE